ncbi:hypothetical protein CLCR_06470 [Cladophialophora carrionii]|uniref:Uncharacterized protein n=1 Tax=Cladophialophora carrionii TaxID=86049 RepID=A0A1C1C9P9_9EURO|nr:hypothetical protein CLCR_06470 [Cladophialophora carrionii]
MANRAEQRTHEQRWRRRFRGSRRPSQRVQIDVNVSVTLLGNAEQHSGRATPEGGEETHTARPKVEARAQNEARNQESSSKLVVPRSSRVEPCDVRVRIR